MDISLEDRWESFVDRLVEEGRFGSRSDVVHEGLRLIAERETKLLALRATIEASIAEGGEVSDEDLDAAISEKSAELIARGHGA